MKWYNEFYRICFYAIENKEMRVARRVDSGLKAA